MRDYKLFKQHDEKLIPTIIRNALKGNPIPIYGDGKNIRDWLDHCKGIDLVYHNGKKGETYNIGGRNKSSNRIWTKSTQSQKTINYQLSTIN